MKRPKIDTGKKDRLGRQIYVDQYGRRVWSPEDSKRPVDKTPDEWYRILQVHGPVYVG